MTWIDEDTDDGWIPDEDATEPRDSNGRTQLQRLRAEGYTGSVPDMLAQKAAAKGWPAGMPFIRD